MELLRVYLKQTKIFLIAFVFAVAASAAVVCLYQLPAEAVIYIASAPKSNSVISAIDQAMEAVRTEKTRPVPVHLKDTHYKGAEKLGHGAGYLYPHDFPGHYVKQQYLPDGMEGRTFYHPSDEGFEKEVKNIFSTRKK